MVKWKNQFGFLSDFSYIISEVISSIIDQLPCKTRFDNTIVKTSLGRFYIENPNFIFDIELFPYFNISYDAWNPRIKKRKWTNRTYIYRSEIIDE
jgi:hypothetical protein